MDVEFVARIDTLQEALVSCDRRVRDALDHKRAALIEFFTTLSKAQPELFSSASVYFSDGRRPASVSGNDLSEALVWGTNKPCFKDRIFLFADFLWQAVDQFSCRGEDFTGENVYAYGKSAYQIRRLPDECIINTDALLRELIEAVRALPKQH